MAVFSPCPQLVEVARELSGVFYKDMDPICEDSILKTQTSQISSHWGLGFQDINLRETLTVYSPCRNWFISISIMSSRAIHVFFIHMPISGHLGCFQMLATWNHSTVNMGVQVFL